MSKRVYLATTEGCIGCKIMNNILEKVYANNLYTFSIETMDYKDLPEYIKINIPLNDFPTLIFVQDDVIKYHHSGTLSPRKLQEIINDIGFS